MDPQFNNFERIGMKEHQMGISDFSSGIARSMQSLRAKLEEFPLGQEQTGFSATAVLSCGLGAT